MLNKLIPAPVLGLLVCDILITASVYVACAYFLSSVDPIVWLLYENGLVRILVMTLGVLIGLYLLDLYEHLRVSSPFLLFQQFCLVFGVAFLFQASLGYVALPLVLPRWIMMTGSLVLLVLLPLWRLLYSRSVVEGVAGKRIVFLGASPVCLQISRRIAERPELGMATVGFIYDGGPGDAQPYLGRVSELRELVEKLRPTSVVVGMTERRDKLPVYELLELTFSGIVVQEASAAYEDVFSRITTHQMRPSQLIFSHSGPRPLTLKLQRIYSFLLALIGIIVTFPILILVGLAVMATSRGPALYRQQRVGFGGKVFTLYKFRSMRVDAEKHTGAVWASRDDPRVSPIGKWLRLLRLDELPQFFNVLKGEMMIVGPRPERPEFVAMLSEKIPFYQQRHQITPGLTGWAQINHKYGDTLEDTLAKLEYDLYYIKHLTPALDFYVLFHTLKVILLRRGAQ